MFEDNRLAKGFAIAVGALVILQLAAGIVNLILLAPVWMQILHLLLADLVWIMFILMTSAYYRSEVDENK
jgi:cytochrome c oxidase assembly protein subunit 15